MPGREVLLAGGTGAVGREIAALLLQEGERVQLVARRTPEGSGGISRVILRDDFSLIREDIFDEKHMPEALFIALGTTIKAVGGSRDSFRKVDFSHVVRLATLARDRGIPFVGVVSAVGADARSPFFYSKVKGEMEDALRGLGIRHLVLARPSLLLASRAEERPAEEWAQRLLPLFFPWIGKALPRMERYRPVPARAVAAALVRSWHDFLKSGEQGVRVLEGSHFFR